MFGIDMMLQPFHSHLQLDDFYLSKDWMVQNGYIRSILVRFAQGSKTIDDEYIVKGVIQHQFVTGTKLTLDQFEDHYNETFTSLEGFFSKSLVIDDPEHKGMLHR